MSKGRGNASAVGGGGFDAIGDVPPLDVLRGTPIEGGDDEDATCFSA
jgi:hypothetical protein